MHHKVLLKQRLNSFKMPVFGLVILAFLSGCEHLNTVFKAPSKQVPAAFNEPQISATVTAIEPNWWRNYGDDELNRLVELALKQNLELASASARIEEADAYLAEVGAAIFPQVDLGTGVSRQRTFIPGFNGINPQFSLYKVGLSTQYEIDFWGKIKLAQAGARAQLLASQFNKATVELTLAGLVAHYYFNAMSLAQQIAVLDKMEASQAQSLQINKMRVQGGVVSILDVYQAEKAINSTQLQREELQRLHALAMHQLQLLTAAPDLTVLKTQKNTLPEVPIPPAGLPADLLLARPDIQTAEQKLVQQQAQIGFARAAFHPSFGLTVDAGLQSAQLVDFIQHPARVFTMGLALNLPIFDGGKRKAKLTQTYAQEKQSLAEYAQSIQFAMKEVNDGLSDVRALANKEQLLAQAVQLAEKTHAIARQRYTAGYSGYLDVLEAERGVIESNLGLIQTRQARLQASVGLFKALGGGWKKQDLKTVK